jgi:integrase
MRGHVTKKGRRWYVVYDEVRGDDGKRVQRWRAGGDTKKEAEETLRTILGTLDSGEYVRPNEQTVGDYLEQWLGATKAQVRRSTHTSYSGLLR